MAQSMLNANKAYATHNNTYIMQNLMINLFAEGCHSHHLCWNEMEKQPEDQTATYIQIAVFPHSNSILLPALKSTERLSTFCFANTNMEQGKKMCDAICIIFGCCLWKKKDIIYEKGLAVFSIEIMLMLCGAGRKIYYFIK